MAWRGANMRASVAGRSQSDISSTHFAINRERMGKEDYAPVHHRPERHIRRIRNLQLRCVLSHEKHARVDQFANYEPEDLPEETASTSSLVDTESGPSLHRRRSEFSYTAVISSARKSRVDK